MYISAVLPINETQALAAILGNNVYNIRAQ